MFPKHYDIQGQHSILRAIVRPQDVIGKQYARVWFRTVVFFVPMALMGVADLMVGMPSGGYYAVAAFTLIPMISVQVM